MSNCNCEPIRVQLRADGTERKCYAINPAANEAPGGSARFEISVPLVDIQGYWTPALARPMLSMDWTIRLDSAAQHLFPFFTFINRRGVSRCAIHVNNLAADMHFLAKLNQQAASYVVSVDIALCNQTSTFELVIDQTPCHWTAALAQFRQEAYPQKITFPEAAWRPVYCTWYAVHADFDITWLDRAAAAAADFGFGTFIVDDGWCFDQKKRLTPELLADWYEHIGDWEVSNTKLPGFSAHVARVRELGLSYMMWVAPFLIGKHSRLLYENQPRLIGEPREGCRILDPEDVETGREILNRLVRLMDLGIDGLKVDFIDAIPVSVTQSRAAAVFAFITELSSRVRACRAEALIEYRQNYCTPLTLPLATQFRAIDLPFDANRNLLHLAQLRAILGDGVPIHADPAYWHPEETPENVALHLTSAMAGVPMVSMDLAAMSTEHAEVVRFWLGFYNEHRRTFADGHWDVVYDADRLRYLRVTTTTEVIVFLVDPSAYAEVTVIDDRSTLLILNLSHQAIDGPDSSALFTPAGRATANQLLVGGMLVRQPRAAATSALGIIPIHEDAP